MKIDKEQWKSFSFVVKTEFESKVRLGQCGDYKK